MMNKFSLFALTCLFCSSCVSNKKFAQVKQQLDSCSTNSSLQAACVNRKVADMEVQTLDFQQQMSQMRQDTLSQSLRMHQVQVANQSLRDINADLQNQLRSANNPEQVKSLLADLQKVQSKLQAREDTLQSAEKAILAKQRKVNELSATIEKQNQAMKSLRQRVADALSGFEGKGLQVINKEGKVYVSMDEKLLFMSGHWEVDAKADSALANLAAFLAANKDIQVVVEGHTDNLAYRGNGYILDNWDLSTKRATAIVRALLKNPGVNPSRISASGRAEFVPLDKDNTPAARQRNRRTEIILSPDMNELLKVIKEQ